MKLAHLSDAQVLDGLKALCSQDRVVLARLLGHLGEVEARRLHLEAACPSSFQFCVQRLGMSEDEAFRRAEVRRALDTVTARHPAEVLTTMPVQDILREALAVLT